MVRRSTLATVLAIAGGMSVVASSAVAQLTSALVTAAWSTSVLAQPQFHHITAPSGRAIYPMGLSADGSTVVGSLDLQMAFRWTNESSFEELGLLLGDQLSRAYAISDDKTTIVGTSVNTGTTIERAFRWTEAQGMQALPVLPGTTNSGAHAVNADGAAIAGYMLINGIYRAVVWRPGNVIDVLDFPANWSGSTANAISADGKVVTGRWVLAPSYSKYHAYRWTAQTGSVDLGVAASINSRPACMSPDGNVIAGGISVGQSAEAFRWTSGTGVVKLGIAPNYLFSFVNDMNADGSIIVGSTPFDACFWTARSGMVQLHNYLASLGVSPLQELGEAVGISADGRTIAGSLDSGGMYLITGFTSGDCYPDCDASGSLSIDDFICFQTFFALGDPFADCDGDASLTIDDFICFQTLFALGC